MDWYEHAMWRDEEHIPSKRAKDDIAEKQERTTATRWKDECQRDTTAKLLDWERAKKRRMPTRNNSKVTGLRAGEEKSRANETQQ